MDSIDKYGEWTVGLWFSNRRPEGQKLSEDDLRTLSIAGMGLAGETGEVLEHVKKFIRDNTLDIDKLKKELGDVSYYWSILCHQFGLKPSEVLEANYQKLESRHARGVMRGSGDNR